MPGWHADCPELLNSRFEDLVPSDVVDGVIAVFSLGAHSFGAPNFAIDDYFTFMASAIGPLHFIKDVRIERSRKALLFLKIENVFSGVFSSGYPWTAAYNWWDSIVTYSPSFCQEGGWRTDHLLLSMMRDTAYKCAAKNAAGVAAIEVAQRLHPGIFFK